jgi:23S rRNA pseudouridine1911/1915/1917 synthase
VHFYHPKWPVFHLDNHLLVLYKPAGLIMQRDTPGKANLLDLAKGWIKREFGKPGRAYAGLVHRLDAPVAGVIVLARTSKAAARLSEQFRQGRVDKTYLAVVHGRPSQNKAQLVNHLERNGRLSRMVTQPTEMSREARLTYSLLETRPNLSCLQIDLETGRHHQIRVQLSAMGFPILGDKAYGASEFLVDGRIALMARRLAFDHPTQKRRMQFEAPLPSGWPFTLDRPEQHSPLWTLEDFQKEGLSF